MVPKVLCNLIPAPSPPGPSWTWKALLISHTGLASHGAPWHTCLFLPSPLKLFNEPHSHLPSESYSSSVSSITAPLLKWEVEDFEKLGEFSLCWPGAGEEPIGIPIFLRGLLLQEAVSIYVCSGVPCGLTLGMQVWARVRWNMLPSVSTAIPPKLWLTDGLFQPWA